MKKALVAMTAVALATLIALPTYAEDAKKADKPKSRQFTGEITAVDAAAKTVTLKNAKGETKTFQADGAKVMTADKPAAELTDLKVGDKVTAQFKEDGDKNIATKIAPPPAKKDKEKKEKEAK
jgi:Cu/Ag efflux protein CusF